MPPSSLSTTSTLVDQRVTLRLEKFSHCTVFSATSRVPFNHIDGSNGLLFLVFDTERRTTISEQIVSKRVMKILCRGDLSGQALGNGHMENVELDYLQALAQADNRFISSQQQAANMRSLKILIRPSCRVIAMQYRTFDNKIRKFQMRFQTDDSFEVCLHELCYFALPLDNRDLSQRPATGPVYPQAMALPRPIQHQQFGSQGYPSTQDSTTHGYPNQLPTSNYRNQRLEAAWAPRDPDANALSSLKHSQGKTEQLHFGAPLPQSFPSQPGRLGDRRPFTAPEVRIGESTTQPLSIDELLPPVRELPFLKPKVTVPNPVPDLPSPKKDKKSAQKRKHAKNGTEPRKKPATSSLKGGTHSAVGIPSKKLTHPERKNQIPSASAPPHIRNRNEDRMSTRSTTKAAQRTLEPPIPSPLPSDQSKSTAHTSKCTQEAPLAETTGNARTPPRRPIQISQGVQVPSSPSRSVSQGMQAPSTPTRQIDQAVQTSPLPDPHASDKAVMSRMEAMMQQWQGSRPQARIHLPQSTADQLAEFAAKSPTEQEQAANNMLVACLQNENFLDLARQMDALHQKGLGL